MIRKPVHGPAALLLLGYASFSAAQSGHTPLHLDEQVVTATRAPAVGPTVAATSVLQRADIERLQPASVPDLLRRLPGVQLTSNGGRGKNTSLMLRGTSNQHVLLLVDGIPQGSATTGAPALQHLPVEQIERIEVVRGPRSSLYGSQAVGGVIQIFTRQGAEQGVKPHLSIGAGSRSSAHASAGVSGGSEAAWFNASATTESTDGINVRRLNPTSPNAHEPDADGYREHSVALRGGYHFANGLLIDGSLLHVEYNSELDVRSRTGATGRNAYSEGSGQVIGGRARFSPLEPWQVTLQAGHSEDRSDNFQDSAFFSRFDTKRDTFSWQNDVQLAQGQLLSLGVDYQNDRIDVSDNYAETSRGNTGYYLQYQAERGRHGLLASLRRDDNEQFGNHDTGNLGWSYALTDTLLLTASYGTAFRAPTFNDLYAPATAWTAGNPGVGPEESATYELGLKGREHWGGWGINAFETQIDDLIVWAADATGFWMPSNVNSARIRGIEGTLQTRLLGWDMSTALTLLDPQDRSTENHGNLLARRAERTLNLDLDRAFGRYGVGATLFAASERYDSATNLDSTRMPGYAQVDLRGEYRIDEAWRLQARLSNLFDREYETAQFFEQPGRAVYFTVRYQAL
ncbi:TonB-dependent vitamin B12 receptor [Stutzerimonas tarimensis]|uniref:TonB-dependent vitamin B12 receptor n=1 Tax=Stutzerimonas tarimensis TaxID=1507735 RepID=A0ABV7T8Z7_9GAMM